MVIFCCVVQAVAVAVLVGIGAGDGKIIVAHRVVVIPHLDVIQTAVDSGAGYRRSTCLTIRNPIIIGIGNLDSLVITDIKTQVTIRKVCTDRNTQIRPRLCRKSVHIRPGRNKLICRIIPRLNIVGGLVRGMKVPNTVGSSRIEPGIVNRQNVAAAGHFTVIPHPDVIGAALGDQLLGETLLTVGYITII